MARPYRVKLDRKAILACYHRGALEDALRRCRHGGQWIFFLAFPPAILVLVPSRTSVLWVQVLAVAAAALLVISALVLQNAFLRLCWTIHDQLRKPGVTHLTAVPDPSQTHQGRQATHP